MYESAPGVWSTVPHGGNVVLLEEFIKAVEAANTLSLKAPHVVLAPEIVNVITEHNCRVRKTLNKRKKQKRARTGRRK